MIEESTIAIIETLAKRDGVDADTIKTAVDVFRGAGMVTTTQARKELRLTAQTVRRMCERHGIRRESRNGRKGSLVDLNALRAVATL